MGMYNGTLNDVIKYQTNNNKSFEVDEIVHISFHILCGLKVLLICKLFHRDLKSANIFFEGNMKMVKDARFVVGDLGESKIVKRQRAKTVIGTPAWIAPEVYKGNGEIPYDIPVDIWSFGMVLYEMFTLEIPYYQFNFVSSIIESGQKPTMTQQQICKYSQLIGLWESCTELDPSKRATVSTALVKLAKLTN